MGDLAPGTMVTSNVRLVDLIARGGMGSVWLADHLGLETRVAVKFIKSDMANQDDSLRERFKREASIAAQIRSIHAVQVFDHGVTPDGTAYIVMELLEGRSLTDRIERDGAMTVREVGIVVGQVAKVLHRAHVLGIIHRDIKPDNIFLIDSDYELFVKVLDFGIAKQMRLSRNEVTKTGVVVGTPEFMSPEQAVSSKHIDHRSDIYSLAVVAYYALTRRVPFDPMAVEPIWMQMAAGRFPPPSKLRGGLPPQLDGWFKRAMHPKPEGRFPSAKTMAEVLAEIIGPEMGETLDDLSSSLGPESRARIVDELSSISESDDHHPASSGRSQPAQYDLFGPDSEAFGRQGTMLMDYEDHSYAEAKGSNPQGVFDKPSDEPIPPDGLPTPRLSPMEPRFKTEPSGIQQAPIPPLPFVIPQGTPGTAAPWEPAPQPAPSGSQLDAYYGQPITPVPSQRRIAYAILAVCAVLVLALIVTLAIQ
jgi:serine/threonine-protein kinase